MAPERKPNTPYDQEHLKDPIRPDMADNRMPSPTELENDWQPDLQLAEGPASNTRIALFAAGIAVILGMVFYGLNSSTMHPQASSVPVPASSQKSASTPPPAVPGANSKPGTTTGTAPANPQASSPASTAPGGADTNAANPSNGPASKQK